MSSLKPVSSAGESSSSLGCLSPGEHALVSPGQSPCEQAKVLNDRGLSVDATKSLACGLPERDAVWWASLSAEKVSNPAHVPDSEAIQAARAWVKDPTPATKQAAGLAAERAGFQTPGAWAAQGAAWSGSGQGLTAQAVTGAVLLAAGQAGQPIPAPTAEAPSLAKPEMTVPKLGVELPKAEVPSLAKPEIPGAELPEAGPDGLHLTAGQRSEMAKNVQPYLDLGCEVGQGKNSWWES